MRRFQDAAVAGGRGGGYTGAGSSTGQAMALLDVDAAEADRVRAVVAAHVHARFALGIDEFSRGVIDVAVRAAPDVPPSDYASRLSLDDLYLAAACAAGDEAAWAECVTRFRAFIRDFARRVLPEPACTDVADEVIADLWERRKIARFQGRSTLRTWLGAVVSHAALNAARARRARHGGDALEPAREPSDPHDLEQEISDRERSGRVTALFAAAIAERSPEERLLLLLYYDDGLTLDEIGPVLRASKAVLSRRLKRIREELRDTVDARARRELGLPAQSLVESLDLARVDLDLRAACRLSVER